MSSADWYSTLDEAINAAHLAGGDDLPRLAAQATEPVGIGARVYLTDLPQRHLHPLPPGGEALPIDSTLAGRAFQLVEIMTATDRDSGRPALWVPMLDGTHRAGVLHLVLPDDADPADDELRKRCWTLAGLLGLVTIGKLPQSDVLHQVRRPRSLSVSAELLWQLLPQQTFATADMTVSAVVEYYDEAGGDGFDYTADDDTGHVAVFDATGHDLQAGLVCSMALAATRNARRRGATLPAIARRADATLREHAPDSRFATAVLARLDFGTGVLSYLNAGHPPPVLLRGGRARKTLGGGRRLPLGLQHLNDTAPAVRPAEERLQPGDRVLFYTDGITEARNARGEDFGLDRLTEFVERHSAAGLPAPETLRRLSHAVLDYQRGHLNDDATLVLLEWPTPRHPRLLPPENDRPPRPATGPGTGTPAP